MATSTTTAERLRPGLILIRQAVSPEVQARLADQMNSVEERFKRSAGTRLRIYDAVDTYPEHEFMLELCALWLSQARTLDETVGESVPTHLLFLKYMSKNGMGFHRDNGENDGEAEYPVVSLSLGNACDFLVKHHHSDEPETIRLNSGDVIIFGGPCRMILHKVGKVYVGTGPEEVVERIGNNRLNLTFRHAPGILGREDEFEMFNAYAAVQKRMNK